MSPSILSDVGYNIYGTAMAFILAAGCVLQALCFLTLIHQDSKRLELTSYFLNIVLANAVMMLGSFPTTVASAFAQMHILSTAVCEMTAFCAGTGAIAMMITLTCSTVKIYQKITNQAIANRMLMAAWFSPWRNVKILVGVWFYATAVTLPPLVGWSRMTLQAGDTNCAPNWTAQTSAEVAYVIVLSFLAFVLPLTVDCVYFVKIYKFLRHCPGSAINSLRLKKNFLKVAKMVATNIAVFAISWAPYCVCAYISLLGGSEIFRTDSSVAPSVFAKASVLFNPIIYMVFSQR